MRGTGQDVASTAKDLLQRKRETERERDSESARELEWSVDQGQGQMVSIEYYYRPLQHYLEISNSILFFYLWKNWWRARSRQCLDVVT